MSLILILNIFLNNYQLDGALNCCRAKSAGKEGSKERKMLNDYCEMSQEPEDGNIDESDIDWADLRAFMVNVSKTSTRQQLQKSVIDDI